MAKRTAVVQVIVLLLSAIVTLAVSANAEEYDPEKVICTDDETRSEAPKVFFAECVPRQGYKPADDGIAPVKPPYNQPKKALGGKDYKPTSTDIAFVSLGNASSKEIPDDPRQCEGYLILEWNSVGVYDKPGQHDVRVHEVGTVIANGQTEATHVYVSVNDEDDWYYIGKTKGDTDSVDISGSKAPAGAVFRYVALCDVADGFTSGGSYPGPDIDAVEAISWTYDDEAPGLIGVSNGEGNTVNGRPSPDGEVRKIDQGDVLEPAEDGSFDLLEYCKTFSLWALRVAQSKIQHGEIVTGHNLIRLAGEVLLECREQRSKSGELAMLDFDLEEGGFVFDALLEELALTVKTPVTFVSSVGRARYDVLHDPQQNETLIRVTRGEVLITPDGAPDPAFTLPDGHTVVVTADSVGEPFVDAAVFVPLVRRQ